MLLSCDDRTFDKPYRPRPEALFCIQWRTQALSRESARLVRFPQLGFTKSTSGVPSPSNAIGNLRRYTAKHAAEQSLRDNFERELAELREKAQTQQSFVRTFDGLKTEFIAMGQATDPQKRGLDFERFLYRLFALFDMEPRLAYNLTYEQIDGSLTFDTDDYIIEDKWWQKPLSVRTPANWPQRSTARARTHSASSSASTASHKAPSWRTGRAHLLSPSMAKTSTLFSVSGSSSTNSSGVRNVTPMLDPP